MIVICAEKKTQNLWVEQFDNLKSSRKNDLFLTFLGNTIVAGIVTLFFASMYEQYKNISNTIEKIKKEGHE